MSHLFIKCDHLDRIYEFIAILDREIVLAFTFIVELDRTDLFPLSTKSYNETLTSFSRP